MFNRELELAVWLDGADGPISPLRMLGAGADGGIGGSGAANGVPFSQSQSERLSGRRVRPSQDGGPFDQFAHPPSGHAITQMMNSRRHIVLMPLSILSPDAGDLCLRCRSALGSDPPHTAALPATFDCGKPAGG
ncbi:hypothetical protein ACVWW4_000599 [Bradyrhizobium sp. LB7.1]